MKDQRYDQLSDENKKTFLEIYGKKAFSTDLRFSFIDDNKQKQAIKITKFNDLDQFLFEKDVRVIFNEGLFDKLDDESANILIEQELDKITVNFETSKISMVKPELVTFVSIIQKYGSEAVLRANQIDTLSAEQSEDMETGFV